MRLLDYVEPLEIALALLNYMFVCQQNDERTNEVELLMCWEK